MITTAALHEYCRLVCQKPDNSMAANVAKQLYLQGCLINLRGKRYVVGLNECFYSLPGCGASFLA